PPPSPPDSAATRPPHHANSTLPYPTPFRSEQRQLHLRPDHQRLVRDAADRLHLRRQLHLYGDRRPRRFLHRHRHHQRHRSARAGRRAEHHTHLHPSPNPHPHPAVCWHTQRSAPHPPPRPPP